MVLHLTIMLHYCLKLILNEITLRHNYRRFGSAKWPFSEKKSYIGSAAFVVGAFVVCAVMLSYLSASGFIVGFDVVKKLPQLLLISILCALVELIPIGRWRYSSLLLYFFPHWLHHINQENNFLFKCFL